ncbi:M20/M25/M40 family metallo-hydrolase [Halostreptopolyspora alba]|uniref:M20/M25/M40 family metallo-hydrolase n=1 Tax=Halostreptopolyspora alba TaxID=2487137 RepID=UPI0026D94179
MFSTPPEGSGRRAPDAHRRLLAGGVGVVVATGLATAPAPANAHEALPDLVTTDNILGHLENLQKISERNGGNRADGTPGHDASTDYVIDQLETAGYEPEKRTYEFDHWEEHSTPEFARTAPEQRDFVPHEDFRTMTHSGSGDVAAAGVPVSPDSDASGCRSADFADFPEDAVAIMRRGTCSFAVKVDNAVEAGASAAVIFNGGGESDQESGVFTGTVGPPADIPVLSTSTAVGEELADTGAGLEVRLTVDAGVTRASSHNVIADTSGGADDTTIVVGAHLDSVPAGPGLNDNGSGVAAILETAVQLGTLDDPANRVRFAFWGSEELGLVGSTEYVENLSAAERESIALYLNFDMIGSPNYGRFVFDGRGELEESMPPPPGSAEIQELFEDYFAERGLASEPTALDGRSDYAPFLDAGIPSGGLFSGAGDLKTEEQAELFGGTAGEPFDPNYHTPDDDLANINETSVAELSGGIAHAVQTYADTPLDGSASPRDPAEAPLLRQAELWQR